MGKEDKHFTPWLAKNLDYISKVVGIDLEYVDEEVQVLMAPYLEPLRKALAVYFHQDVFRLSQDPDGRMQTTSFLRIDSQDEANWDRMADWQHESRAVYEDVLRISSVR